MVSEELIANFIQNFTNRTKLKREKIKTENCANKAHYEVGNKIRNTIKQLGGMMPEDFPTPTKSLKQIEKENNRKN